jgi:hypothetical protein
LVVAGRLLLTTVVVLAALVDALFREWPLVLAHELRLGHARRRRLILVVDLALFLETAEDLLLVVIEEVFSETVGLEQANTAVLGLRFELEIDSNRGPLLNLSIV